VHLVGKDILRFHAVIWPAMLMAAGVPVPKKVFAHGWLLVGGEKMSKSKLTGIAPSDITKDFGVDAFRYYFLRAIPFGTDGSFSWEDMAARYTSELANDFGNLASRLIAMVEKYCDEILYNTAESLRALAVLLHPVMPEVTEKLWRSLGADKSIGDIKSQKISEVANWGQLPAGSTVTKTEVLFPRLEEAK